MLAREEASYGWASRYSIDLRERVVAAVGARGMSCHQAAKQFGVGVNIAIARPVRLWAASEISLTIFDQATEPQSGAGATNNIAGCNLGWGEFMTTAAEAFERSAEYFRLSAIQAYSSRESLLALACELWQTAIDLQAAECHQLVREPRQRMN